MIDQPFGVAGCVGLLVIIKIAEDGAPALACVEAVPGVFVQDLVLIAAFPAIVVPAGGADMNAFR